MPCSHQDLTLEKRLTPSILLLPLPAASPLVRHSHLPLLPVQGKPWPPGAQSCPSRDIPECCSPESRSLDTRTISFAGARLFSVPEAPGTRCPRGRKADKERRKGEKPCPITRSSGRNPGHPTGVWNLGSSCGAAARLGVPLSERSVLAAKSGHVANPGPGDPRPGRCRWLCPRLPLTAFRPLGFSSVSFKPLNSGDFTIGQRRGERGLPLHPGIQSEAAPRLVALQGLRANGINCRRQ